MRIAMVGGMERHEREIARRARADGHDFEAHRGRVGGRHAQELEAIVSRSDVVVIVTDVNSHGAMYIAKRAAAKHGRPAVIVRSCSPSTFSALLGTLPSAHAPGA